jgi:hypothetical protein
MHDPSKTRGEVFEPLVTNAKHRAVELARVDRLTIDDTLFLLRALDELEVDGAALFDSPAAADGDFYRQISVYLTARVGESLVGTLDLDTPSTPGGAA